MALPKDQVIKKILFNYEQLQYHFQDTKKFGCFAPDIIYHHQTDTGNLHFNVWHDAGEICKVFEDKIILIFYPERSIPKPTQAFLRKYFGVRAKRIVRKTTSPYFMWMSTENKDHPIVKSSKISISIATGQFQNAVIPYNAPHMELLSSAGL